MGDWSIYIRGRGAHHNEFNPIDANRMVAEFVDKLRDAGHIVETHEFVSGRIDVVDGTVYLSQRDEVEAAELARRGDG